MNKDHKELCENKVRLDEAEEMVCDNCFEPVVFHLKDKENEFSMGLSTVLECIVFAIQKGDLPKLPLSWLSDADGVCHTGFSEDNRNYYHDGNFPRKRE